MQIFSLPTYDYKTDTFKDGPLPKNVDSYFSKSKDAQNYYSWELQTDYLNKKAGFFNAVVLD